MLSSGVNCRLQLVDFEKEKRESQPALCRKRLRYHRQIIHRQYCQYSLPVEALNLVIESKSLPVEMNDSAIELHGTCASRRKKSLQLCTCQCRAQRREGVGHRVGILTFSKKNYQNLHPPGKK